MGILIYGPLAMGGIATRDFLVLQGATIAIMFLWLLRLWLKPKVQLLWPPICWSVLAFTGYAVARYFTSPLEYPARIEVIQVVMYTFLFLAILNNLHRQEHTQLIVFTLVFLGMAVSFYALYQFATNSDKVWTYIKPYKHRGSGTYISPNNLAGFLEMLLPLGLAALLVSRAKPVMKILIAYASLVILGGVAVTLSRGGWVATGVALLALFGVLLFHRNYRLPAAVLLVVLVGGGVYFIPKARFLQARVEETTANDRLNDSARFDLWEPAVRLWKENIWWGIGPNHYNYRFREYRPQTEQQQPDRVHNDYLNTLTDWGIVGVILVTSAFLFLYLGVLRTWRFVRGNSADLGGGNSNKFALVLGASLGILAILIHSAVDFNMHVPANAILAITLMALLSSTQRFATESHWVTARFTAKTLLTLLLLGGLTCLIWQETKAGQEYRWLQQAKQSSASPDLKAAILEKAFAIEPGNSQTAYEIGEIYRIQSWEGADGYEELARRAMNWFDRCTKINPFDGYGYLRYGMCLDWIGKANESATYFEKADKLDPNGYFTAANIGWHFVQAGDYAAARTWFERSKYLEWNTNVIADTYLPIVNQRLLEAASGTNSAFGQR
ncbi:MAG TPA: O-antigen ligase family protein [Candidatus Paceibacterota bacterium]|nr:O-antigen ligase family protein [Candidatus Paceibacterota bacterium]